jgi:uncharacterized protein (UPF0332 family)
MEEQIIRLAQYRINQAKETLKEAEILAREHSWRGVVNRAYYAMFYAVLSLAVVKEFSTSKHSGTLAFFDREFIKPGIFPKKRSKQLHLAFDQRQAQDYGEFILLDEEMANEILSTAAEFVEEIDTYLHSIFPQLQD